MRSFTLGIDASRSRHPKPTGVERYSTEIIRALLKEPSLRDAKFRLYTPERLKGFAKGLQVVIPFPRMWTVLRLSFEMLIRRTQILFVPAYGLPFFAPRDSFVTIHDIAFEKFPKTYGSLQKRMLKWTTKRALGRARAVFVPTQSVADDLNRFYGSFRARVVVVPHGPLPLSKVSKTETATILKRMDVEPGRFVLFVGRLESKKNLAMLVKAWPKFHLVHPDFKLVLAGRASAAWESPKDPSIVEPGFVDERVASALLNSASMLVLPSLDEGFGFPLLQAFEANCPVLCSKIPALVEVGADAVLLADAKHSEEWTEQMDRLASDSKLRKTLVAKGALRLKDFSWKKAARQMAQEFLKVSS